MLSSMHLASFLPTHGNVGAYASALLLKAGKVVFVHGLAGFGSDELFGVSLS
jgi:hypothetical protein